ncbi:deoxyUTP pyrophosphatase [Deinococcus proteolyticus MRP]|uniref:dUTP diphosphatase n=1 Tax=Deinococcus proteolyticus (strain ATCC 35074 / DSM 20540 / JCM 6276 / NBRC 101906 / NCIMB 13154 / VKM Ac-1939 / CCM 2703 / MRP) TaxID=693977 RepID=F0RKE5_DEIPM|nr:MULTISPECIES: dUTPase [Deinococcus]ADY26724.1 deoxyUTP pyrophosphatase [Deinococcus proteolyticus MRP]MCY1702851.1 dUTP diphosphatase [Deinococcus sp. SL84]
MRGFQLVSAQYRQHPDAQIPLPRRGTRHSAGYDFVTPAAFTVAPGEMVRVATDVKAYMGPGEVLQLYVRSSAGLRGLVLANTVGIVDADYYGNPDNDGNIILALRNLGAEPFTAQAGDRVAQGVFVPYLLADGDDDLEGGEVRTGGYGHTGR